VLKELIVLRKSYGESWSYRSHMKKTSNGWNKGDIEIFQVLLAGRKYRFSALINIRPNIWSNLEKGF